jgi:hypothetical protein
VKCGEEGCDRQSRSRGMCAFHYKRAQRAGLGKLVRSKPREHTPLEIVCQQGKNPACVDCGVPPLFGGMRCLACFQRRCEANAGTDHLCVKHPPGASCYQLCRCRCEDCRAAKRAYARNAA